MARAIVLESRIWWLETGEGHCTPFRSQHAALSAALAAGQADPERVIRIYSTAFKSEPVNVNQESTDGHE